MSTRKISNLTFTLHIVKLDSHIVHTQSRLEIRRNNYTFLLKSKEWFRHLKRKEISIRYEEDESN